MSQATRNPRRTLVSAEDLLDYKIDGRYRLNSIVGGGGMGVVYRTSQQSLGRPVALKLLKLNTGGHLESVERFKREVDIVSRLSHPNIVRVYDSGVDPELSLHFVVMELIEGVGLDALVARWKIAPQLALEIAHGVCAALTEPHRLGIVHRDIKPGNILLTLRSDDILGVKVVDFGISRATHPGTDSHITATGEVVGTPSYMAPEVARGAGMDGRADLYAVGVMLHEMLSGQPLFEATTPLSVMLRHISEQPPPLSSLMPADELPQGVSELVDVLLAKSPNDRHASAHAVLRHIEEIRQATGMKKLHLDATLPTLAALRPWLRPLNTSPTNVPEPTMRLSGEMPHFEGWLIRADVSLPSRQLPQTTPAAEHSAMAYAATKKWINAGDAPQRGGRDEGALEGEKDGEPTHTDAPFIARETFRTEPTPGRARRRLLSLAGLILAISIAILLVLSVGRTPETEIIDSQPEIPLLTSSEAAPEHPISPEAKVLDVSAAPEVIAAERNDAPVGQSAKTRSLEQAPQAVESRGTSTSPPTEKPPEPAPRKPASKPPAPAQKPARATEFGEKPDNKKLDEGLEWLRSR